MRLSRDRDGFLLQHEGRRFVARRRLDRGRGFALVTWWGGFVANCDTLDECEARAQAVAAAWRDRGV